MHSKNIISWIFTLCFVFAKCIFIRVRKTFRTLLFLCETNISGLAARYKVFGVNAHKEIIRFEIVCPSKYKIHVAVAFGGNAASIALRLVLGPPRLRAICFSFTYVLCCVCFPVTSLPFWWRYIISFIATAAYPAVLPIFSFTSVSPTVFLLFRPGSFRSLSCSSWVISDHCCNPSSCCFS